MILIFFKGGFGNQIFQAQFVKSISEPNEIIISKTSKYFEFFEYSSNWRLIKISKIASTVNKIAILLTRLKIITLIKPEIIKHESEEIELKQVSIIKGLFPSIKYVSGYFQTDSYSSQLPVSKSIFVLNAKKFIDTNFKNQNIIFIHVRRGDYIDFTSFGENVLLPYSYYFKGIKWFEKNTSNPIFLFFSDEIELVEKKFKDVKNCYFFNNSEFDDFSLMISCKGGIISNSTFSWWAGYLLSPDSIVIAPKYWLGWRKKIWHPAGIKSDKFKYLN